MGSYWGFRTYTGYKEANTYVFVCLETYDDYLTALFSSCFLLYRISYHFTMFFYAMFFFLFPVFINFILEFPYLYSLMKSLLLIYNSISSYLLISLIFGSLRFPSPICTNILNFFYCLISIPYCSYLIFQLSFLISDILSQSETFFTFSSSSFYSPWS